MQGWPTHRPKLCVSGYRLSRSTGTVFLFGIMVGAVAPLERRALDWLPAHRGHNARRAAVHLAFTNRARDTRLEHQQRADTAQGHRRPQTHIAPDIAPRLYQSEGPTWPPTQPF